MPFTPGDFDFVGQVDTSAIDALMDVVVKRLQQQGKAQFTHQVPTPLGPLVVDVELTGMGIPDLQSANPSDRFRSNIVASLEVEAEITFTFLNPTRTERVGIRLKDLQAGIPRSAAGAPIVSLEFNTIDVDVIGLGTVGQILNFLLDVAALGIRAALSALGMKPVPVFPVADAAKELGLAFSTQDGSPYLGTNQTETGLAVAMDFEATNQTGSHIHAVQDILVPPLNTGLVLSDRLANQALGMVAATRAFGLVRHVDSGGIRFGVTHVAAHFETPRQQEGRVRMEARAAARVRRGKGGFLGRLFGRRRKVTIRVQSDVTVEAAITPSPPTPLPRLEFAFVVTGQGSVSVSSVLASILQITMGPLLVVFLLIFNELLNLTFQSWNGQTIDMRIENSRLVARLNRFQSHIGAGHGSALGLPSSLGAATLSIDHLVGFDGFFELGHFTMDQLATSQVPMAVDYGADSFATRDGELFLGVGLRAL